MFVYSIPIIGMIFLLISLSFSKTFSLLMHQLSIKRKNCQSVNHSANDSKNSYISIQVNPLPQLTDVDSSQEKLATLPLDDDEELIKSDTTAIAASNFCENHSIELRLG